MSLFKRWPASWRRLRAAGALGFALGAWQPNANAQPAPGAQPPAVVRPELVSDEGAVYPERALAENLRQVVVVDLVIEVDAQGLVSKATVETPRGHGFDEAALDATRQLRFKPARRQGIAVPARIRYRYTFEPPPEPPLPAPPAPAPAPAEPAPAAATAATPATGQAEVPTPSAPPPMEVTVLGEKLAPASKSFTREEIRRMPGTFGDPFRAIEAMPGVTPTITGLPFFYVRGAPPGNVGYFLDGIRVPYLFHVAIGPSVIHPGLVDRVDLHSGGYPARFGRFAGGIVSAETTAPRSELHGEANVRLFDAGALAEAGFAGGRGTVLLGGRYSYTATIISLLAPDVVLDYRDFQARISYKVGERDTVSLFSFGSYDLLGQEQPGGVNVLFGTEFYRADLREDHHLDHGNLRTALTLGYDRSHFGDNGLILDQSIAGRSELQYELTPAAKLRSGVDVVVDRYEQARPTYYDPDDPGIKRFDQLFPGRTDRAFGFYSDVVLDVAPRLQVTPGLRVDLYTQSGTTAVGVDPRVAARFKINDRLSIVHAYGIAHQPPAFVIPIPGLTPADLSGGLQESLQVSAGAEVKLDDDTNATATVFDNVFLNMSDALGSSDNQRGNGDPSRRLTQRNLGSAVGFELFVRRRLGERFGGFLSYTLSRSTRSLGREQFLSAFDRTHVLNFALAYQLGRHWQAGGRIVFYTGVPSRDAAGQASSTRSDPFFRLDVRLEKRWLLGERAFISFVLECLNATLSKENFNGRDIGPVTIPSVGVELGF